MKTVFRTLILVLLALSLTLALLSCTNKEDEVGKDDSWMKENFDTSDKTRYAQQQQFGEDAEEDPSSGAMRSDDRVYLPSIPRK